MLGEPHAGSWRESDMALPARRRRPAAPLDDFLAGACPAMKGAGRGLRLGRECTEQLLARGLGRIWQGSHGVLECLPRAAATTCGSA